jgi:hypothetical protein
MDDIGGTKDGRTGSRRSPDAGEAQQSCGGPARANARSAAQRRGIQSVETGLHVLAALVACGGPAPLSAVALSANATRELRRLGVLDQITAVSTEPTELIYRSWRNGRRIAAHPVRQDLR